MKFNRTITLFITLILIHIGVGSAEAQMLQVKQTNGKAIKTGYVSNKAKIIPLPDHQYLLVLTGGKIRLGESGFKRSTIVRMRYLDDDLTSGKEVVPELKVDDQIMSFEGLFKMKNGFILFLTYDNKKKRERYLFAGWYDLESQSFKSDPVKIAEIKLTERGYVPGSFNIVIGEDQESFLVTGKHPYKIERYSRTRFGDDKEYRIFDFWVYDDQMNLVNFREDYKFEYDGENKMQIDDILFDKSGNVYLLGAIRLKYISGKILEIRKEDKPRYEGRVVILQLRPDGKNLAYEPESENLIFEAKMRIHDDGKRISIAGIEGVVAREDAYVTSVLYDVIDIDSFISISSDSYLFPDAVYDNNNNSKDIGSRRKRSSPRQDKRYEKVGIPINTITQFGGIAIFEVSPDGIPFIVIEQKYIKEVTSTTTNQNGSSTTRTTSYYHYRDAIACTINNDRMNGVRIDKDHYLIDRDIGIEIKGTINGKEAYMIADDLVYKMDMETNELSSGKLNLSSASGRSRAARSGRRKAIGGENIVFVNVYDISPNEFIAFQNLKANKVVMHKITF